MNLKLRIRNSNENIKRIKSTVANLKYIKTQCRLSKVPQKTERMIKADN